MSDRFVLQQIQAQEVSEGAGVNLYRSIGIPALRNLDPFLMLDNFSSENPDDYLAGFPDHPHRGFNTFTYMLDGQMHHSDSMGNQGDLRPGGAQWMKAGSGIIHAEMPQQQQGRMRGFQLWINLPAGQKMSDPAYQEIRPEAVPELQLGEARVRLLAGEIEGQQGPVADADTRFQYMDVSLPGGAVFSPQMAQGLTAFVYLFEGDARIGSANLGPQQLAVLGKEGQLTLHAGQQGARLLLVAGRAIGEPIVQQGPFVMNTRQEIEQAMQDYRDGRLVRSRADMTIR